MSRRSYHAPRRDNEDGFIYRYCMLPSSMKKILPFWFAAMIMAVLGIVILQKKNIQLINYIEYPETNPLLLAEAYREEGEKYYKKVSEKYASLLQDADRREKMKNLPELARARRLFLESLKIKPASKGIYPFLSDLAEFEGDLASMYYYQGKRALLEDRTEAAIEAFDFSLNIRKDFLPPLEEIVSIHLQKGDLKKAEQSLEAIFRVFAEKSQEPNAGAFYLKSLVAQRKGNLEEQREALEIALEKDPSHIESARFLAGVLSMNKEYDRAVSVIERARASAPYDANLLHWMGMIYMKKGDYAKAAERLEDGLKIEKNSAPLYLDLARSYEKLGKKSHSSLMLQKAMEIDKSLKTNILFPKTD
ncbi:tetratricopeptide repeat protein [Candidatus Sumerlaeota bacterium]|nr:tetratricopeptide repeat protein [Candidatus Sumerlaeota bacterium]